MYAIRSYYAPGNPALAPASRPLLAALRALGDDIGRCGDLSCLFDATVKGISSHFGIGQVSLLLADESGSVLYTVASSGFEVSGIGAEVPFGFGVVGVCAREQTRITSYNVCYTKLLRAVRPAGWRVPPVRETLWWFPASSGPWGSGNNG